MAEQAQIAELKAKMRDQRDHLLATIEALSEQQAERSTTGEGEWSAKQQMSHLCEMESAYRAWVLAFAGVAAVSVAGILALGQESRKATIGSTFIARRAGR